MPEGGVYKHSRSGIISGFGKEHSVWEDFAFLLKDSVERCQKKSNGVLNFQVRIWVLLMQMSSAAADLPDDKDNWVRVYPAGSGGL